jgi:hypothetical protein
MQTTRAIGHAVGTGTPGTAAVNLCGLNCHRLDDGER